MDEYKDPTKLSECCAVEMYSQLDICPQCKEPAVGVENEENDD